MPQVPRRILVPTDFSSIADNAQRYAIGMARTFGAELHILHVQVLLEDPHLDSEHLASIEKLLDSADADRQDAMHPGVPANDLPVETHLVRSVSASEAIVATAEEIQCDVVVMGTHGRRGLKHLVLGSVAEEVVRSSPAPVMTVRPDVSATSFRVERVLVPHDFSEHSFAALELAAAWARKLGSAIELVHIIEPVIQPEFYAVDLMPLSLTQELRRRSLKALEDIAAERLADVEVNCEVASGRPSDHIIHHALATRSNLIIMGTRGLSAIQEVLLGSVTEGVLRRSEVPLLTVRGR